MKKQKNLPLTADKIMLHDDFIRYMENSGNNPWKTELENKPELKEEFEKAVQLHEMLSSHKKNKYPEEFKNKQTYRLISRINADDKSNRFTKLRNLKRIAQISAAAIIILTSATIIFIKKNGESGKQESNLQIIVPSGEKSQLILPDGTQVWLNSESKLVYPVNFNSDERRVTLEGEAYFDVAKLNKSQFTVYTQNFKVKVLGTKFNVKSYPKDLTIETTVIEGMVKVEKGQANSNFSPIILKPTERLIYKKDISSASKETALETESVSKLEKVQSLSTEEIFIGHVNTHNITSWKDHLLVFDNETFEEIALKISRWYKVQINLQDEELKTQRYTGKFVHNESLTQVLEAIKLTTPIKYQLHQNSLDISLIKEKSKSP